MTDQYRTVPIMTKGEAEEFKARWRMVNEFTDEELRSLTVEEKFRRLNGLFNTARTLGWTDKLREGEEEVRDRWRRLKEAFDAKGRII